MEPEIHPTADVSEHAIFGDGSIVWAHAVVEPSVSAGINCVIGSCAFVGRYTVLGDRVRIQHGAFIPRRSKIGNNVFIGPNVTMTDDKYPAVINPNYRPQPPVIEDDASIGAGAVLLPGVTIGRGATIGAGAVVTDDVPPYQTWVGVPARRLETK